jgi:drug/metabolite transporter (DMT)-like permease
MYVGVVTLTCWSASVESAAVLVGDAMFLAASALGALYVLQLRKLGIGPIQSAAIVTLYSALIVVPWNFGTVSEALWHAAPRDVFWQILWQGVLVGCVALVALNHAIARLGPERSSALVAFVPVLSALLALLFLGEIPSATEVAAILVISHRGFNRRMATRRQRRDLNLSEPSYFGRPAVCNAAANLSNCGLSRPG